MAFFERLLQRFRKAPSEPTEILKQNETTSIAEYSSISSEEVELVSILAASFAARDYPESRFMIRSVKKRNKEKDLVAAIATAIAAADKPNSTFVIKKIRKR